MTSRPVPVWLDADPGFDDLVAWLLLDAAETFTLQGVSIVAGNAPLEHTFRNALNAREFFGLPQPVYAGRGRPLTVELVTSQYLLGENGMASVGRRLPTGKYAGESESGVNALIRAAREYPGELTVLATGPLTNVAQALLADPNLPLREIVWMGGSTDRGNHTAAAEFNAFADPEAADLVFASGLPVTMVGLNLTRQVVITPRDLAQLRAWGTERALLLADHLEFYLGIRSPGVPGPMPFHDPAAALWLLKPESFVAEPAHVRVELTGVLTRGMTVCEFRVPKRAVANASVLTSVVDTAWRDVLMKHLQQSLG
ncbi:nucleoside hydrolase [Deinococcus antarcticus]|uniref:Nucleoside hydrolase n=1 Tax=Deinococcus antarcticus TaxID=1298767 RepID=A0ABV8A4T6_9DEIO